MKRLALLLACFLPTAFANPVWTLDAPPSRYLERQVQADWRAYASLQLDVQLLTQPPDSPLLLSLYLRNKQGDWIECQRDLVLDGTRQRFVLDLTDRSPHWRCANADRSFGIDQLRWVTHWGLRLYSAEPYLGQIQVGTLALQRSREPTFRSVLPRDLPPSIPLSHPVPVTFELEGDQGDVFDPTRLPSVLLRQADTTRRFDCAWVQDYRVRHVPGRPVPETRAYRRPVYRAWVQADQPGSASLLVDMDGRQTPLGRVRVHESPPPTPLPADGTEDFWIRQPGKQTWTPVHRHRPRDPLLDWTPAWGSHLGLGWFEQRAAWVFEQELLRADHAAPLTVFSETELDNHTIHNWSEHPWNRANGGPLAHPSDLWDYPGWQDLVLRRAVYLWHRYGALPQVNGLHLDISRAGPGHVQAINELCRRLQAALPDAPITCNSPGLPARTFVEDAGLMKGWEAADALAPGSKTVLSGESEGVVLDLRGALPGAIAASADLMQHWATIPWLVVQARPESEAETPFKLHVQVRTDVNRVYESPLVPLFPREDNRLYFNLRDPGAWTCLQEPNRPWTDTERLNVREVMLRFFQDQPDPDARVLVQRVDLCGDAGDGVQAPAPLSIALRSAPADTVDQFARVEWTFDLNRAFRNPYDSREVTVDLLLTLPDGSQAEHPGFYWEDVHVDLVEGREQLRSTGDAAWKIRISPWQAGSHRYEIRVNDLRRGEVHRHSGQFEVAASGGKGFVLRSARDPAYFEYSDGSFYFPLGQTVRSPSDRRPGIYEAEVQRALDEAEALGTHAYERWFRRMQEEGANFARVWMSSWWLGLEWNHRHPGYHGRHYFNQANAARLDRIVTLAETYGIHLNIETLNHGALSSTVDEEWQDNPWAASSPDKGPLRHATEFFYDAEALHSHLDKLRYTVARWGYSTAVAWWGVATESEWIEPYNRSIRGDVREPQPWHPKPYGTNQHRPRFVQWLEETARFLRETDMHPHAASTHFSNPNNGLDAWPSPEMQVVYNNAYRNFFRQPTPLVRPSRVPPGRDYPVDAGGARSQNGWDGIVAELFGYDRFFESHARGKLLLVGEWGGSPHRNRDSHLIAEFHSGLWAGAMTRAAGSTGYWWWNLVDVHNLFPHFKAVAAFMEGEDRRGLRLDTTRLAVVYDTPSEVLQRPTRLAIGLYARDRLDAYLYPHWISRDATSVPARSFDDERFPDSGPGFLCLPDAIENGDYQVEYWNTFSGEVLSTLRFTVDDASRELPIPSHRVDLALKLRRQSTSDDRKPAPDGPPMIGDQALSPSSPREGSSGR